eukprot:TRINITY_DN1717_c0_g1_i1.p1 TRINITY_DN1717_c0_g1~~TRINITY_DN1717_c0_g1_i1.p1  ORF type:complete len:192 (-),score=27.27 TRINITY_DN1717_c0_g1_i1:159-734(-)
MAGDGVWNLYTGICSSVTVLFFIVMLVYYVLSVVKEVNFFYGYLGVVMALSGGAIGSAYGIAKSALGILEAGRVHPGGVIKNLIPVVMAGMLGIYGLIISVFIVSSVSYSHYSGYRSFAHLWSGSIVGLSCIPVGFCTGIVGCSSCAATGLVPPGTPKAQQLFVSMVLLQVFAGACGLYALIVGLLFAVQN